MGGVRGVVERRVPRATGRARDEGNYWMPHSRIALLTLVALIAFAGNSLL